MKEFFFIAAAFAFALSFQILSVSGSAQEDRIYVVVSGKLSRTTISPGETVDITLTVQIDAAYHINSHEPNLSTQIPTVLIFEPHKHAVFDDLAYPEGVMKKFSYSDVEISIYEGEVVLTSKLGLSKECPPGKNVIMGKLFFQACDDQGCLPPAKEAFEIPFEVKAGK